MFEQLFNNHFLYSLSLTLLHFLWQGVIVGLILKSALSIIDKNKSKLRYGLATVSMLANLVLAAVTFVIIYSDAGTGVINNITPIPLNNIVNELIQESNTFTYQELIPSILAYSLPYLSILWLATIVILAGKLLIEVRNVNHLPMQATVSPTDELLIRFSELAKQIQLPKTPKLLISLKVDVPMAIGWLKPVVLLPAGMVAGLDSAQLEMLLLHELAHIRRHDYLINFLQTLIELLFFFHPCIHWIGKQMRNEREYCSDDVAVQHCGDAIAYAHTLTDTASLCAKKHSHTIPTMAMAASGGDLKARVVRLVDHHCAPNNDTGKWLAALSLLLAIALMGVNQLLTAPFTYKLTNQSPWYDSNTLMNELKWSIAADTEHLNDNKLVTAVANNSIALQLLNRTEDNSNYSLKNDIKSLANMDLQPEAKSFQTLFDTDDNALKSQKNETGTTETTNNKLIIADNRIQQDMIKNTDDVSNTAIVKHKFQQPTQLLAQTPNIIEEKTKNISLSVNAKQNKKPTISNILTASTAVTKTNINPIEKTEKYTHSSLSVVNFAKVNPQTSVDLTHSLGINTRGSQAIDEFELQNEVYTASHESRSKDTANFPSSNTQLPIKEKTTSISAKLLNPTSPVYPSIAKLRGLEMEVKVNFTVDRNGKVKDIDFGKQYNATYFKSAIRSAIRKWRFTPATVNNDIVETKMSKIFSFSLQS